MTERTAYLDQMKNYEDSYKRMWEEIACARRQRDNALKIVDLARDLVLALEGASWECQRSWEVAEDGERIEVGR